MYPCFMSVANVLALKFLRLNDNQLQLNLKSILEFDMIMKLYIYSIKVHYDTKQISNCN